MGEGSRNNSELKARIGSNARRFREENDLKQQQVAERIGVTVAALSRIETGQNAPKSATLIKLASIYGRPESDFYAENPPPPGQRPEQPVFMLKVRPGVEVDDELIREVNAFLAKQNRRQFDKLRQRRQKKSQGT